MNLTAVPWTPEFVSSEIERAVAISAQESGVRRVWLFGSVARKQGNTGSDLDFAVEGWDRCRHFAVLEELLLELRCPVDLLRWEEANDVLRSEIVRQGTVVYAT